MVSVPWDVASVFIVVHMPLFAHKQAHGTHVAVIFIVLPLAHICVVIIVGSFPLRC